MDNMTRNNGRLLMFSLFRRMAVLAVLLISLTAAQAAPQHDRCVVLVSIDGLANFYLDDPPAGP
jgi:hypothetical protein